MTSSNRVQEPIPLVAPLPLRPLLWYPPPVLYNHLPVLRSMYHPWLPGHFSLFKPVVFAKQRHQQKSRGMTKLFHADEDNGIQKEFGCPHCKKACMSAGSFHAHLRSHMHGCECPICGKSFSRHWLLQGHIRTHTGEKPFHCPVCHKAFADKSNLRAHIQTHSGLKPHRCRRCGKAFALKSYLSKHEESACVKSSPFENVDKNRHVGNF